MGCIEWRKLLPYVFSCFRENKCVDLDLTLWKFQSNKCKNFAGMFEGFGLKSKETNLNLSGWNVKLSTSISNMFQDFALEASSVTLKGVENWEDEIDYQN